MSGQNTWRDPKVLHRVFARKKPFVSGGRSEVSETHPLWTPCPLASQRRLCGRRSARQSKNRATLCKSEQFFGSSNVRTGVSAPISRPEPESGAQNNDDSLKPKSLWKFRQTIVATVLETKCFVLCDGPHFDFYAKVKN